MASAESLFVVFFLNCMLLAYFIQLLLVLFSGDGSSVQEGLTLDEDAKHKTQNHPYRNSIGLVTAHAQRGPLHSKSF